MPDSGPAGITATQTLRTFSDAEGLRVARLDRRLTHEQGQRALASDLLRFVLNVLLTHPQYHGDN